MSSVSFGLRRHPVRGLFLAVLHQHPGRPIEYLRVSDRTRDPPPFNQPPRRMLNVPNRGPVVPSMPISHPTSIDPYDTDLKP